MTADRFSGVLVPVATPFGDDLTPDAERLAQLCRLLLEDGAGGLAVFGTTSEANSLSAGERMALLDHLIAAGIPAASLMPGTGACSVTEAAALTRHATKHGCGGVLMLPPFYYKAASDDGLFDFFRCVIDDVASDNLRVYLYHIPPVAQVGFSLDLIERLIAAYPATVVGLKDSSGDWSNTAAIIDRFPGFSVFPGSEVFLLDGLRAGGAGCISATANVNLAALAHLATTWREPGADDLQTTATRCRRLIEAYPVVPAVKAILAARLGDPGWARVRPPFRPLAADRVAALASELAEAGFGRLVGAAADRVPSAA